MQYFVTVRFQRKNQITGKMEASERTGEVSAAGPEEAKKIYLKQFLDNKPTRRRVQEIRATEKK